MRKRQLVKKTSKILVPVVGASAILLVVACAVFLIRGQQRLLDLVSHTSQKATEVYTAWLELNPTANTRREYILQTLALLGYEKVPDHPKKPGQYATADSDIELWTRGFEYPDLTLSSQTVQLAFFFGKFSGIKTLPEGQSVERWRLEPKRLARWAAKGGASQPQVRIGELPVYVSHAVVAVEDKRFYEHGAIDLRGLARAIWVDLRHGRLRQGGSTISQQLSRSIFLDVDRTFTRKLLEAGLAFFLEALYSKDQLLEMYLNQVYWGQDGVESLLGLESASRSYFGKPAKDLTLGEAAMLAGLLQSPNHYSPRADPQIARQRRSRVLVMMLNQGFITPDQFRSAVREPIRPAPVSTRAGEAPYFVATLQDSLIQRYSLGVLMTQGWKIFTTLDPVLQSKATAAMHPSEGQAAMVAMDPRTGGVRAWVGGTDYAKSTFDRVVYAHRQPGSAIKPIVLLAAIDSRKVTEATLVDGKKLTLKTPQGPWSPQNYDRKYQDTVSVWDALVYSINIPTIRVLLMTGPEQVVSLARFMGIRSPLRAVPSLALGTSEVTVLELTNAYATLANAGKWVEPYVIESIQDAEKQVVESHVFKSQDAVGPGPAFILTHMLQSVFEEGTAKQAKAMGFTHVTAGKTGTSENYQDAWFLGYTPALACGVWVGHDQPKAMGRAAAGIALPVWVAFMQPALDVLPEEKFAEPEDIEWKTVDIESGELARSGCQRRRKCAFLPGTAPDKMCTLHPGGIVGFFYRFKKRDPVGGKP